MSGINNLRDCKVFINAEKGNQLVAKTVILDYDSERMAITVDGSNFQMKENEKVSLLVLHASSVYEYLGIVRRKDVSGRQEITLFKGHEKEDRESIRYVVNVPGKVEGIFIGNMKAALNPPPEILIVNISTSGILMRTMASTFNVGTSFQFSMSINSNKTVLTAIITRVNHLGNNEFEYGCSLTGRG